MNTIMRQRNNTIEYPIIVVIEKAASYEIFEWF